MPAFSSYKTIGLPANACGEHQVIDASRFCYSTIRGEHICSITYLPEKKKKPLLEAIKTKILTELAKEMRIFPFIIRVHKSWIINTRYIRCFHKTDSMLTMQDGTQIPVSNTYRSRLCKTVLFI